MLTIARLIVMIGLFLLRWDARVLAAYRRVAHAVQRLTGHTSWWMASQCALVYVLSQMLKVVDYFWQPALAATSSLFDVILAVPLMWLYFRSAEQLSRSNLRFQRDPSRLPVEMSHWNDMAFQVLRAGLLILLVPSLAMVFVALTSESGWQRIPNVVSASSSFDIISYLYLLAVIPLPPGQSKVRQWLTAIRSRLQPIQVNA